ncbi:hypothetical protein AB3X96_07990 [Paraburkholderia sp. BR13439]|uniref:hypothetical protein n=1 Tax=Paraburkholderia sp. BR13439 TaxID=3236996 RepID=UPI0034CE68ED
MARVLDAETVTATSEPARNTLTYGRGGDVCFYTVQRNGRRTAVRFDFIDQGPGIAEFKRR